MSTQHTPGPWKADQWAPGWSVSAPESHYTVCRLEGCNNAGANARLIAAAPDMLASLRVALTWMETYHRQSALGATGPLWADIQQAREVIAKAEARA